jgi:hypothetical protein
VGKSFPTLQLPTWTMIDHLYWFAAQNRSADSQQTIADSRQ